MDHAEGLFLFLLGCNVLPSVNILAAMGLDVSVSLLLALYKMLVQCVFNIYNESNFMTVVKFILFCP
jgi:hypothetical protein